jgi:hypothetical protein
VLDRIEAFTVEYGGHVIANAGFAELDQDGRPRAIHPAAWMGVQVRGFHREPRDKTGVLKLQRQGRSTDDKPIDVQVSLDTYSARPITLDSGETLKAGPLFGNEDTQMTWSCQDRHELYWEDLEINPNGEVIGRFRDGKPAIVKTGQTLYIARDTTWVDDNFEKLFLRFLKASGVTNANSVTSTDPGVRATSVDLRMWEGAGRRLLFVINSAPTLQYHGQPLDVDVRFDAFGDVTDALTGKSVQSRWDNFKRVIPLHLKAGEVRVLLGKPYLEGYRMPRDQSDEVRQYVAPSRESYRVWRRTPRELWVQDTRVELGMGNTVGRD